MQKPTMHSNSKLHIVQSIRHLISSHVRLECLEAQSSSDVLSGMPRAPFADGAARALRTSCKRLWDGTAVGVAEAKLTAADADDAAWG